ncbi:MAG: hypothetical protein KGL18_04080 [Burkholderiales bacterium]|nr:hypothetical protein [Burkholderiales bacterium]MDE1927209.1 hypothetical protein [Burkholderiales bacterium]MDE2502144.1 hypothetical protein [Burkholderiales bacterium]
MNLVPFSAKYLRLNEPLPFGLRDADGRLLLAAGHLVEGPTQLAELTAQPLYAAESEAAEWNRRLAAATDAAIRGGASLQQVASVRPDLTTKEASAAPAPVKLAEQWGELATALDAALREMRPGSDWRTRLFAVHGQERQLAQRQGDASLYHLIYEAGTVTQKYCCRHALLVTLIAEQAAAVLGWSQGWIDSLGRAALTMNVAMMRLQDQLAVGDQRISDAMRAEIKGHAEAGARRLLDAVLGDALAIEVVRLHHDSGDADQALAELAPERRLARLLRRVDIYAAKISCRATRQPMSPLQAAREACLGPGGVPDEIGGALLKAVGLYPPGSFVQLVSGEVGIVVARGRRANLPYVASLVSASGMPLGEPALRDTLGARHAVKGAVAAHLVKVRPQHERLLALM